MIIYFIHIILVTSILPF